MSALTKLDELRRELGAWNAALYLINRILERLSRGRARLIKYYIVAQPISGRLTLRPDPSTVIAFTPADDPLTQSFPRPPGVIAQRYAQGAYCLTATVKGRFAGFLWWQHGCYEEDEVRCTYSLIEPQRCVWDYDVYVDPAFRLGRTLMRLWQAANEHLAAQSVQWSYSRISAFNGGSLRAHARLGMRPHQSATFLLIGPLQVAWLARAPFLHVSFTDAQRPLLKLATPPSWSQ